MPEDEDIDELKNALEDEQSLKEERIERTEKELSEYDLPNDYDFDKSYDIQDAQKEIAELKQEVRDSSNEQPQSVGDMSQVEKSVKEFMKAQEYKNEGKKEARSHKHHEAYSVILGGGIMLLGFRWSPVWTYIYFVGLLAYIRDTLEVLPEAGNNKYARLVTNHPSYFIYGGTGVASIMMASGAEFPMPPGMRTEIGKQLLQVFLAG